MAESPAHPLLVMIDTWEYRCCGDPLRVGDTMDFHLLAVPPDRTWGRRLPVPVEWTATHHSTDQAERLVRAQVFRLWEGFADLEPTRDGWRRAPSSGSLRPILVMDPERDSWAGDPDWRRPGMPAGRRRPRAAQAWVALLDVLAETRSSDGARRVSA